MSIRDLPQAVGGHVMPPEIEQSLTVDYEELFALPDRIRQVADTARARLLAAGLPERLEPEVFGPELELRGTEHERLLIRLDSYRLEITGAPPSMQTHLLAAILLDEAGVFRLTSVELGLTLTAKAGRNRPLNLIRQAFSPVEGGEPMLDRRFSLTWDWGNATTGYSFLAADTEDRELFLSFKAREGYMTLPDLEQGYWMHQQAQRFDGLVERFMRQIGWQWGSACRRNQSSKVIFRLGESSRSEGSNAYASQESTPVPAFPGGGRAGCGGRPAGLDSGCQGG
jgi:hypothetical protein